ncbi:CHAT domain-containing protein [Actinocorallia aurea]
MPALVLTGPFAGAERHLVLVGEEVEAWGGMASGGLAAMGFFINAMSAAVTAVPEARVVGVQGGVVQYYGDLPKSGLPRAVAEQVLGALAPDGQDAGWDPAGYDEAGRQALTLHASAMRVMGVFEQTGDPALLDRAAVVFRAAIDALPVAHPHRSNHLVTFASFCDWLFESRDDIAALRESARLWREIAAAPDAAWRHGFQLGRVLAILGEQLHDAESIGEAITELRAASATVEPGGGDEVEVLAMLCSAHRLLAWLTRDASAAAEAVAAGRRLVALGEDHPQRLGHLEQLALALRIRAELTEEPGPLDEAVDLLRQVLHESPSDGVEQAGRLHDLALALASRAADGDGEEALELLRRAAYGHQAADADQRRAVLLASLAGALTERYRHTQNREVLEEALTAQRHAVELTPQEAGSRPARLLALNSLLHQRYERSGSHAALDERIEICRELAHRHPDGPRLLGQALTMRHRSRGEHADLAEAIEVLRGAVSRTAADALTFNDLALALQSRYTELGDLAAMRESAELIERAVHLTPAGSPDLPGLLSNLAHAYRTLFERTGEAVMLDHAIDAGRRAAAAGPSAIMDRVGILTNLGLALMVRARTVGDLAAGAEAVGLLRQAVDLLPPDFHDRGLYLSNLALALAAQDPAEALEAARRAVETTPYGAARAERLTNLLLHLAEHTPDALDEIMATARAVLEIEYAPPITRVRAAGVLGGLLARRAEWAEATRVYVPAIELLPQVAPRDLARTDQEHGLAGLGPLAEDGAACALRSGDPELALRLLEQGRGVLLGQALDDRSDVSELRLRSPELAERFERLRDRLSDPATGADETRVRLGQQWREVLQEIRSAPGWTDFLRPPQLSELLAASAHGPIAVLNPSEFGGDALIVSPGGVRAVPLPGLTPTALDEQINALRAALQASGDLAEILRWLWDVVAEPVLNELGFTGTPESGRWPRLWWCPAGPLALLPLHAAGRRTDGQDPEPAVLDRVISSYTPTIRALLHARSNALDERTDADEIVVVSVPNAPGAQPLPGVLHETENLVRRFPGSTVLAGRDATRERVLRALAAHRIAHFACHATSDPVRPSHSHLVLWDHERRPLTVLDLSRSDLGRAQLAYLSACQTAATSPALADEALHMTAACQLAGFPHVIGTLWPISDWFAARTTHEVYTALSGSGGIDVGAAPEALHQCLRRARDRDPGRAGLWAAFVHFGS